MTDKQKNVSQLKDWKRIVEMDVKIATRGSNKHSHMLLPVIPVTASL